jgi:hypothetical protein
MIKIIINNKLIISFKIKETNFNKNVNNKEFNL